MESIKLDKSYQAIKDFIEKSGSKYSVENVIVSYLKRLQGIDEDVFYSMNLIINNCLNYIEKLLLIIYEDKSYESPEIDIDFQISREKFNQIICKKYGNL